ncbi:hypothetical protein BC835DRAFT_1311039 [Cytidiella melzeri]|nr:hypothetical protein BC835DRAFT_1311039 [Cytidiella melzeri]
MSHHTQSSPPHFVVPQSQSEATSVVVKRSYCYTGCDCAFFCQVTAEKPWRKTCTLCLQLVGGGPKNDRQTPEILLVEDSAKEVLKNEVIFLSSDWVGCGRHWSDTIPLHVVRARNAARQIPSGVNNAVLLQPDDTISAVLQQHLHLYGESPHPTATYSNHITTVLIHDAATKIEAAGDLLWASATSAMALKRTFDDAWLSGARQSTFLTFDLELPDDFLPLETNLQVAPLGGHSGGLPKEFKLKS